MNQSPPPPPTQPRYQGAQSKKEKERLAKALRQNLQRRKNNGSPAAKNTAS